MTDKLEKKLLLEVNNLGVNFKIKNDKSFFFAKPQTLKAVKDVSFKLYEGESNRKNSGATPVKIFR